MERIEAHHEDYDKPFIFRWLCILHHKHVTIGMIVLPVRDIPDIRALRLERGQIIDWKSVCVFWQPGTSYKDRDLEAIRRWQSLAYGKPLLPAELPVPRPSSVDIS
jgi:hypothetical protein